MGNMDDSMAYPGEPASLDLPAWKNATATFFAIALAIFFAAAGVWKIVDPIDWSAKLTQFKIPGAVALPFTLLLGITEATAATLLVVPRFRRWGAWISGFLLIVFMVWFAIHYRALTGADCSCFPFLKRVVGPEFFVEDALMLGAAFIAGWWARPSYHLRGAGLVLLAVAVFAGVSYGVAAARQSGTQAPETIQVDGQPYSLRNGRALLYFFDPECSHCFQAAQEFSRHKWKDVQIIGIPTRVPQFGDQFLAGTQMKAKLTGDLDLLKKTFPFGDPPYAVALENGRQKAALAIFDDKQPAATLRELGFIE